MISPTFRVVVLSVVRSEAKGAPNRALTLHCEMTNPGTGAFYIADAWLEVKLAEGPMIAEGRLFHGLYNMVDPALVWSSGKHKAQGEIIIPLSVPTIEVIEKRRNGGDLQLHIDSRVLFATAVEGPAGLKAVLTPPIEGRFSSGPLGDRIEYRIPQSEWITLLRQLEWADVELVELPLELLRSDPRLARARERLRDAQTALDRGDWEGVLQNCRKAWEAAAIAVTGEINHQSALPGLKERLGDGPKAERLNAIAIEVGRFLHLGRHEQAEGVAFDRADAVFATRLTTSLLSLLASR